MALLVVPSDVHLDLPDGLTFTADAQNAQVVLAFVRLGAELDTSAAPALAAAGQDRLAWIAYPKAGQLGTDLNRDRLASEARLRGVQPVRQVSIDHLWSALRFRPS